MSTHISKKRHEKWFPGWMFLSSLFVNCNYKWKKNIKYNTKIYLFWQSRNCTHRKLKAWVKSAILVHWIIKDTRPSPKNRANSWTKKDIIIDSSQNISFFTSCTDEIKKILNIIQKYILSWQILVFVHSNFTDYLRIAQAIITNRFRAKCSGWHFHPTPAVNKIDQFRQKIISDYIFGKKWFLDIQTSQIISKYHRQSLQIVLWQSIWDEIFAPPRVLTDLTKIGKTHI